jgi:hypothetical protein
MKRLPGHTLAVVAAAFAATLALAQSDPNLTLTGTLNTGVMAIGAETTGTTLTVGGSTFELDIRDATLRKTADSLSGKQVTVKGTLTVKQGVETGQRRIIEVTSLQAAGQATQPASQPASTAPAKQ